MNNKFRNVNGARYLRELFFEMTSADKTNVLYTLKDEDHKVGDIIYPSLYKLYMASEDPTEYEFFTKYLDGLEHWERLCEAPWFIPYVSRWRREFDLRMKSRALKRVMTEAKTGSKESLAANRYLIERGWVPKDKNTKGRPSKEDIKKAAIEHAMNVEALNEDAERLGLKIN